MCQNCCVKAYRLTYKQFVCKYSTKLIKRRANEHLARGFSLLEVLIALVMVSIFIVYSAAVISLKLKASTNVSRYISTCIVKDGANLTTSSCLGAIKGCQSAVKNDCNAVFSYVDSYPTQTYKLARAICDQDGETACSFLMDKCNENYANCDMTGSNDIDYYLGLSPTDINKGRAYIETLGTYYYNQGMANFKNYVDSKCGSANPPLSNTACKIANYKEVTFNYTFDTNTRTQYSEKDLVNGTIFDSGAVRLLAGATTLCWGDDSWGELGDSTFIDSRTPVGVSGGHTFLSTVAGYNYTCGVDNTGLPGNVWCWGRNDYGQLGNRANANMNIPVQVSDGHIFSSISSTGYHTCGIDTSGKAWCWGYNGNGQLGTGNTTLKNYPMPVSGPPATFNFISAGYTHNCGIDTSGNTWCWGANAYGQLGDGTTTQRNTPVKINGHSFSSISAGFYQTCGIDTSNNAWCWGLNNKGQLGNNSTTTSTTPVQVSSPPANFTSISAGDYHTCGIDTSGNVWCWGNNASLQLGNGMPDAVNHVVPEKVPGGYNFSKISCGYSYSCGIVSNKAYCWGTQQGYDVPQAITSPTALAATYDSVSVGTQACGVVSAAGYFVESYVTTTWQNSLQNVGLIDSVDIDETVSDSTTPYQSTTRWLVSFDGSTWGKLSPPQSYICQWTSKTANLSTFDFLNNGNTSAEIHNYLNTCALPNNARTLYFAIDLLSADGHILPQVNNIQVKYYK